MDERTNFKVENSKRKHGLYMLGFYLRSIVVHLRVSNVNSNLDFKTIQFEGTSYIIFFVLL